MSINSKNEKVGMLQEYLLKRWFNIYTKNGNWTKNNIS
jgi:hypothetical protein